MKLVKPFKHFSQGDLRWADRILGKYKTFRKAGCAVTSLAMMLNNYEIDCSPYLLDNYLDNAGGYWRDSVYWAKVLQYYNLNNSEEELTKVKDIKSDSLLFLHKFIKEEIDNGWAVVGGVCYKNRIKKSSDHYVCIVGYDEDGNYAMLDPATKYGNYFTRSRKDNIIGFTKRKGGYRLNRVIYFS